MVISSSNRFAGLRHIGYASADSHAVPAPKAKTGRSGLPPIETTGRIPSLRPAITAKHHAFFFSNGCIA
jgi:hypothetical protein